jgi:hypothetical protein
MAGRSRRAILALAEVELRVLAGRPSNRTTGSVAGSGRSSFTTFDIWLRPPVKPTRGCA